MAERLNVLAWKASRGDEPLEGSNPSLSAIRTLPSSGAGDAVEMGQPEVEAGARLRFQHGVARNDFAAELARERRARSVVRVHHHVGRLQAHRRARREDAHPAEAC